MVEIENNFIKFVYNKFKIITTMTEREMFERSFLRPHNYFKLSAERQWEIDKELGILDWMGKDLTEYDKKRIKEFYL